MVLLCGCHIIKEDAPFFAEKQRYVEVAQKMSEKTFDKMLWLQEVSLLTSLDRILQLENQP